MFFLVSYDIRDPKRLYRVAKVMENFGTRVQLSVFECDFDSMKTYEEMIYLLKKKIDPEKDSVRIYSIGRGLKEIKILGQGRLTGFDEVIII